MDVPNSLKILVVEDDAGDVLLLKEALKHAYSDFEFWHVRTVMEAYDLLQKRRPDVVILDLSLPDGVGVEVVHKMHACAMQIPIVVLTGRDDEAMALICLNAGAQDFLSKSSLKSIALRRSIAYALSRQKESSDKHGMQEACYQRILTDIDQHNTSPAAALAMSLKQRDALKYEELVQQFRALFAQYLDHLIFKKTKPSLGMSNFVSSLIGVGGGARDLIDMQTMMLGVSQENLLSADRGAQLSESGQEEDVYTEKFLTWFGLELMTLLAEAYSQTLTAR